MISTSAILSTGEKKWMPMNCSGLVGGLRQLGDRQGGGVGGEDRVRADGGEHVLRHLGLHLGVLEHRLDDQVAPASAA
jgi:hypothetical protein